MNRRTIGKILAFTVVIPAALVIYGAALALGFGTGLYIAIQVNG